MAIDGRQCPAEINGQRLVAVVPVLEEIRLVILGPTRASVRGAGDRPGDGGVMPPVKAVERFRRHRAFAVDPLLDLPQVDRATERVIGVGQRLAAKRRDLPAEPARCVPDTTALRRSSQQPAPVVDGALFHAEGGCELPVGQTWRVEDRPDLVVREASAHARNLPENRTHGHAWAARSSCGPVRHGSDTWVEHVLVCD